MISKHPAPGLFARMTASSPTYTPSLFLALRTNTFRREALGDHEQAPAGQSA